ncbi:MAG: glutaredoxin domain-containing protein [Methanocellales archaeon]|nr:glutaredoxin domain-containing protein [Methanocellales archaeon]
MDITIYTTPTCPFCHRLKDFLTTNKIQFKEVDVSKSQEAAEQLIEKSGQIGVPVIEIDGETIVDFDVQKLKEKLKIK